MDCFKSTIGEMLRCSAETWSDRTLVVDGETRLTYGEFDKTVDKLAGGFQRLGVGRGDHVACWMTNGYWWLLTWFACCRLGAPLVAVNTRYKAGEVGFILRQSDAKVLVAMPEYWGIDYRGMIADLAPGFEDGAPGLLSCTELPNLRTVVFWGEENHPGTASLQGLIDFDAPFVAPEHIDVEDPVIIIYTSGTTGDPKGAMHCHRVLRQGRNIARAMHRGAGDKVMGHMPLYHVAGSVATVIPAVMHGLTFVTMDQWEPARALDLIEAERINIFGGIPTHFIDLLSLPGVEKCDTRCLKSAWIGGAPVTPAVAHSVREILNFDALQAVYGMTETMGMTALAPFDAPIEVTCANKGLAIGDYEYRVVDRDTGEPVSTDTDGEIQVRGHILMLGYYKDKVATDEVMTADGWFRTGDLGQIDSEGYLMITGRAKEMFIVGGSNAYPAEIERFIETHPDVEQAFVCGIPHPRLGEVCSAFIIVTKGARLSGDELIDHCRGRIADYKVPRHVEILDDFPRTTTNKIQRYLLQDLAAKRFRS